MIDNRKSMGDIAKELVAFLGETQSETFATNLGEYLHSMAPATAASRESKGVHIESKQAGKILSISSSKEASKGMLQGALRTGRAKRPAEEDSQHQPQPRKREFKPTPETQPKLPNRAPPNRAPSAADANAGAYSEMMRLAQAAGFSSPAEMMMMQQQQLMTLMQGMQTVASFQTHNQGFHRGGYGGRSGRGRGFMGPPESASAPPAEGGQAAVTESGAEDGYYGGRGGRGRGGYFPRGGRGYHPFAGGHGRGRGRIANPNRSWVRSEDGAGKGESAPSAPQQPAE